MSKFVHSVHFKLRYGPPRDAPILSTLDESTSLRRCYSDVTHAVATSPSPFSSGMDPLPPCKLIRLGMSPPEAIQGRRFSQASDVWSWGVTVWEVWSGGAEPWSGLSSDAVLAELRTGRRLAWPRTTCPRRLYQLLLAAWRMA
ncbi:protein KINase family member kin 25 [Echinococcus multilocularis]|uniref:Protein KINase family member kin 25 n=1 Tax=Echinococcus multilocularis TaxID=6211 RepID=A0A068Y7F2_ECHMU|nr:protein KINase family member kin 25 [Echinococcus multilocularis]